MEQQEQIKQLVQENMTLHHINQELASKLVQYEWHNLYWTIKDIAFNMIEQLKSYDNVNYFDDFLYNVYQREPYIDNEQEAMNALSQYSKRGIYDVIADIEKYANDNDYSVELHYDKPIDVASCLYALLAEKVLNKTLIDCNLTITDKLAENKEIVISQLIEDIDNANTMEQLQLFER